MSSPSECSKIEKKVQFQMCVCMISSLPQRLKSTFFEIFSNGAAPKRPAEWFAIFLRILEHYRPLARGLSVVNNTYFIALLDKNVCSDLCCTNVHIFIYVKTFCVVIYFSNFSIIHFNYIKLNNLLKRIVK